MEEVYCIKLASGDELIARVIDDQDVTDALVLKDVYTIGLQQVAPNEVGVGMMPWLVGNHTAIVNVSYAHIVTTYAPNNQLSKAYLEKVTGLVLAH
jgi:hypothetical protein